MRIDQNKCDKRTIYNSPSQSGRVRLIYFCFSPVHLRCASYLPDLMRDNSPSEKRQYLADTHRADPKTVTFLPPPLRLTVLHREDSAVTEAALMEAAASEAVLMEAAAVSEAAAPHPAAMERPPLLPAAMERPPLLPAAMEL
ncbi:hypothetical protein NQ318_015394, partial [Aromia moschata]